ncbi:BTAD domain-containing putative transcriptional regulator [Microbispora sp. H10830]|uniref:BTAD domain-containing putative transcriptional regulator n=1 Tax=Microbispora sp. H10830 TaxID=2729109 RepID=UPI0016010429|nr:BTAD domain-containing putative transcriptional regulator [Microbispora sp. H10830]
MLLRILGPIEIRQNGEAVRLTAPKTCALLAALVTCPNEPVVLDGLVDAVWPSDPPPSAADNLRVYVAQLRRVLGDGARIASVNRGYALNLDSDELDARRFEDLLAEARRRRTGDLRSAAAAYRDALALWRGPVFGGADLSGRAHEYAVRLEEERAAAVEERIDVELALGRHSPLIGELRGLVAAHPLRERLHGQLMLALYRSGRQAEALEAYRNARRVLVEELGLDPGPELRAIESAILAGEPMGVSPAPTGPGSTRSPAVVPSPRRVRGRVRPILAAGLGMLVAVTAALGLRGSSPTGSPPTPGRVEMAKGAVGDGVLTVRTLLPVTGSLYFLGAATAAGADLAVQDVNAAGGVLGRPVRLVRSDSGDPARDIASSAVADLLARKADLIVGAVSNTVSLTILDQVTEAGAAIISPSNTSSLLTSAYDRGLYFRTAPGDDLQGRAIGRLIAENHDRTVAIMALDDPYSESVIGGIESAITRTGSRVVRKVRYDEDETRFAKPVNTIVREKADALVLIGFEETAEIVKELRRRGVTAGTQHWYLVDGNLSDYSADLPRGTLLGARGTLAGADAGEEFARRMRAMDPSLGDLGYGPEAYDAVILGALAAEAARGDLGQSVAARLRDVSSGGRRCTSYRECSALVRSGLDIDYDGLSGRIEFDSNGDVTEGTFGVYEYTADNTYSRAGTRVVTSR